MIPRIQTAVLAAALLVPAFLLALPAGAAAQAGLHVRITPRAGLMTPVDWFFYEVQHLGVPPFEWTEASIERAPVIGLTAELEVPGSGIWIRGEIVRTLGGEAWVTHAVLRQAFPNPPRVDRTDFLVPSTITIGSLDFAFPTRLRLPFGVQPYVALGVGGKRYSFDNSVLEDATVPVQSPSEGVSLVANLGGGVTVDLFDRIGLDLQVRDAVNDYLGDTQHDILWLAGLRWELY